MNSLEEYFLNACHSGDLEVVDRCVKAGVDINTRNETQRTGLMNAAYRGRFSVIRYLLDWGADRTLRDSLNETAEDDAREQGRLKSLDLLRNYWPTPVTPDQVIYERPLSNRTLEEVYDFTSLERISMIRKTSKGAVEAVTREKFSLINKDDLRKAFNDHRARGGTADEMEVFSRHVHAVLRKRNV